MRFCARIKLIKLSTRTMPRKNITPKQKFNIVMESFQKNNVVEVARKYEVNANLISTWRSQLLTNGQEVFGHSLDQEKKRMAKQIERLERLVGRKEIEIKLLQNFFDSYESPNGP